MPKTAVVTGASAGVGRATARAFAEEGFDVALVARGSAGLEAAAGEVVAAGGRALAVEADVSRFEQVDAVATRVEDELGPVDVWINDAMTTVLAPLSATRPEDFRRAVEVTFLGQVWGTMAALKRMQPRDAGTIVNVGSALSFVGIPLQAAYCASKFACRGFFESTRAELLHEGSHVNLCMVHLPAVNTPQFDWCKTVFGRQPQPIAPIYQPEACARRILNAALTGRRSTIVGPWTKLLVLIDSALPAVGDHYAALSAWDGQFTDTRIDQDRVGNLDRPVDVEIDHGAHGRFDARAAGLSDPQFIRELPHTLRLFFRAARLAIADRRSTSRNSIPAPSDRTGP